MNYIFTFFLLFSLLSCDKKASIKRVDLPDLSELNFSEVEARPKKENLSFYKLPIIKLHGVDSSLLISNSNGGSYKQIQTKIYKTPYIRNKIQRIIHNPYQEKLDIEDLFTFSFQIKKSELLNSIKEFQLNDLKNYTVSIHSSLLLESSQKGLLQSLDYESGLAERDESREVTLLTNTSEQTSGFEFSLKPKEQYQFQTPIYSLYDFFKSTILGGHVEYHILDFVLDEQKMSVWKEKVFEEGSILIVSNENKEDFVFINDGETVHEAMIREGRIIDDNADFRTINFNRFDETISANQVLALYFVGEDSFDGENSLSHLNNVQEVKFNKIKDKDLHIVTQLRANKYTIKHWYESQVLLYFSDGMHYGDRRSCNVSRRKIQVSPISLDMNAEKFSYNLSFEGRLISLESLIKSKNATVEIIGNKQLTTISRLPTQSDHVEVLFSLRSDMVETVISQDRGQCKLMNESRRENDEGVINILSKIEKFESFKESSAKGLIGVDKFMDILIIN